MNVALYVAELSGHNDVYARFLSKTLSDAGHHVDVIAVAGARPSTWADGVESIGKGEDATLVEVSKAETDEQNEVERRTLCRVFKERKTDAAFFLDADFYRHQLTALGEEKAKWPCWTAGIFTRTAEWYPGEPIYFEPSPTIARQVSQYVRSQGRRLLGRRGAATIFFDDAVSNQGVLDLAIVKDERVLERGQDRFTWMPEIFVDPEDEFDTMLKNEEHDVAAFLDNYRSRSLESAKSVPELLLFVGRSAHYKGYDYFLKLAELDRELVAVHVGVVETTPKSKPMDFDVARIRARLLDEGRLWETGCFASPAIMRKAFSTVQGFVSFHRLATSSGTVLQAIAAGKPVLTPSKGVIGHRTRKYAAGMTYRPMDIVSLKKTWMKFKRTPKSIFKPGVEAMASQLSMEASRRFFVGLCEKLANSSVGKSYNGKIATTGVELEQ